MKIVAVWAVTGVVMASFQAQPTPVPAMSVDQVMAEAYKKASHDAQQMSTLFDYRIVLADEDMTTSGPKPNSRHETVRDSSGLKTKDSTIIRMQDILQPGRYRYEFGTSQDLSVYHVKFFPAGQATVLLPDASFGKYSDEKNATLSQMHGEVVIDRASYAALSLKGSLVQPIKLRERWYLTVICEQNDIEITQTPLDLPAGGKVWILSRAAITYRLNVSPAPDRWKRQTILFRDFRPKTPRRY